MGGNGNQLQYSCLGNLMDREAWRAIVHVVAESDKTAHACMLIKKLNMIISYNPPNLLPGYTLKIFSYMCKCHYFNAQSKILKQNFQEGKLCVPSFPSISLFGKFIPCLCTCVLSHFSCVWLCVTLWTATCQVPLTMGFSRQEYWSVLPCPPPGDLPDPGIEPTSLKSICLGRQVFYQ